VARNAILIANSIGFGEQAKYPSAGLSGLITEIKTRLKSLGEDSFRQVSPLRDLQAEEARARLRAELSRARSSSDLLLLYYFGHAVETSNGLYFFFKDSDSSSEATMLGFEEFVRWIRDFGFPALVLWLDCCHAGSYAKDVSVSLAGGARFYLMASATGKANALPYGRWPIGIFTENVLAGFRDPEAAQGHDRSVTFGKLFKYAKDRTMTAASEQVPYDIDGGLAGEVLLKQGWRIPRVLPFLNEEAHRKSSYMKLFLIITYLYEREPRSLQALYSYAKRKDDVAFHTPVRTRRGNEYRFMSIEAFSEYVDLLGDLGAVQDSLQLTTKGRQMASDEGKRFNGILWDLVQQYWQARGFNVNDLFEAISYRVGLGLEPSAGAIHRFLFQRMQIRISPARLRRTLDLAGFAGAVPYCSEKTFYPLT